MATPQQVLERLHACQGICLDDEEWEFVFVAKKVCDLFGVETPKEWDEVLNDVD